MLIELTNHKAAKLIYELEALNLIKVIKTEVKPTQRLSQKYAGTLPEEVADKINNYVAESRNEWNSRTT
jgi:hypothetical protein